LVSRLNKVLPWFLIAALAIWIPVGRAQSPRSLNSDLLNLQLLSNEDMATLESLLDNPVNLNSATAADLWFLDDSLVSVVLVARRSGPFSDWADLTQRTRLPSDRIQSLRQFVYLTMDPGVQARLSTRLAATGSDERIRTRLNLNGRQWAAQWVVQRDPGEYHLTDLSDLSVTIRGNSTRLALGSHRMTWGLGLVLADEFASPRGETLLRPTSRPVHLRPGYSNTNNGVLRGASVHHNWSRFQLFAGTSHQQADITSGSDGTSRVVAYRTHSGPATTTSETIGYLAGTTSLLGWEVGGLTTWYHLQTTSEIHGMRRRVCSLVAMRSFQTQPGEWYICHEEAIQLGANENAWQVYQRAGQTRLSFIARRGSRNDRLRLTLMYRSYPPGWVPLRGRLVGDRVSRGNESGWFFGWRWDHRPWKISGYHDGYRQVEPNPTGSWPREGWESGLVVRTGKRPVEASLFYRRREEAAGTGSINTEGLYIVQQRMTASRYARFVLAYTGSRNFTARFMTAVNTSGTGSEQGIGETLGGSLRYSFRSDLSLAVGAYGFATDGWDQRLYVYEDGLPGEFNFRALSGRGVRMHGRIALPVGQGLISLRVAQQWYYANPAGTVLRESRQAGLQMDIAL